jgi:hypothetical protein
MKEFDTSRGAHAAWPDGTFARIVGRHLAATANTGGRVGGAQSWLIPARGLLETALAELASLARDT